MRAANGDVNCAIAYCILNLLREDKMQEPPQTNTIDVGMREELRNEKLTTSAALQAGDDKDYPPQILAEAAETPHDGAIAESPIQIRKLRTKKERRKIAEEEIKTPATKDGELPKEEAPHEFCDMGKMRKRRRQLAAARKLYCDDLEKVNRLKNAKESQARHRRLMLKLTFHGGVTLLNLAFLVNYLIIDYQGYKLELVVLDFVLAAIFAVDFLVSFTQITMPFTLYFSHIDNLVDVITLFPPVVHMFIHFLDLKNVLWTLPDIFNTTRVLRFYRTFIKLRAEMHDEQLSFKLHEYTVEIMKFGLRIVIILFMCAGLVLFYVSITSTSDTAQFSYPMHFWDALYFCLVTFSTIGYGCIRPTTIGSKYFVVGLIFTVMVVFANQITGLADALQKLKVDVLGFRKGHKHIVVLAPRGDSRILLRFLKEYYMMQSEEKVDFLLLSFDPLTKELATALLDPKFNERCLGCLRSGTVDKEFLGTCNMAHAKALFILTDQHGTSAEIEDSNVIIFCREVHEQYGIAVPTYIVLAESEEQLAVQRLTLKGIEERPITTINTSVLKYKIMAKNIFTRGFIPLFEAMLANTEQYLKGNFPSANKYCHSVRHTEYTREFPSCFVGKPFISAVRTFYKGADAAAEIVVTYPMIMLLGVVTKIEEKGKLVTKLIINPYRYTIKAGDIAYMLHFANQVAFNKTWQRLKEECNVTVTNLRLKQHPGCDLEREPKMGAKIVPTDAVLTTEREVLRDANRPSEDNPFQRVAATRKMLCEGPEEKSAGKSILKKVMKNIAKCQPTSFRCQLRSGSMHDVNNEDLKGRIENHIVVCGFHKGLRHFVKSVRNCSNIPICFLFEGETPLTLQKMYTQYKGLLHFQGSADDLTCLTNASVASALHVIVLATINSRTKKDKRGLRDARTVMAARLILNFFPQVQITLEMKDFESLELMDYVPIESQRKLVSYVYWPNYMMGRVFVSSLLDTLPCRVFQSPHFIPLIDCLLKTSELENSCHRRSGISECDNLHSFLIPKHYTKNRLTFETLFNDLLDFDFPLICIGIYCCPALRTSAVDVTICTEFANMSNTDVPVVYLNPPPETVLNKGDYAMCVGFAGVDYGEDFSGRMSSRGSGSRVSVANPRAADVRAQNFGKLVAELNRRMKSSLNEIEEESEESAAAGT